MLQHWVDAASKRSGIRAHNKQQSTKPIGAHAPLSIGSHGLVGVTSDRVLAREMASARQWPESLKLFVNQTFAQCTPANKAAVEQELKAKIYQAYSAGEMESTNWSSVQLARSVA